jgi:hypothetical protein
LLTQVADIFRSWLMKVSVNDSIASIEVVKMLVKLPFLVLRKY